MKCWLSNEPEKKHGEFKKFFPGVSIFSGQQLQLVSELGNREVERRANVHENFAALRKHSETHVREEKNMFLH